MLLLWLLLPSFLVTATDWYVSPNGNDGNSGSSPTDPLATINTAYQQSQSFDTIYLMPGGYSGIRNQIFIENRTIQSFTGSSSISLTCDASNDYFFSIGSFVNLTDLSFASCQYGVLGNDSTIENFTISNTTFTTNVGVQYLGLGLKIINSEFRNVWTGVNANAATILNTLFISTNEPIWLGLSTPVVEEASFFSNITITYPNPPIVWNPSPLVIFNASSVTFNSSYFGYVSISPSYAGNISFHNCTFANSSFVRAQPGELGNITITDSYLESFDEFTLSDANVTFQNVYVNQTLRDFLTVTNVSLILENVTIFQAQGVPLSCFNSSTNLTTVQILNTTTPDNGGGLQITGGTFYGKNVTLSNHIAYDGGGFFCGSNANITFESSNITNNSASIGGAYDCGRGNNDCNVTFVNTTITDNWSSSGNKGGCGKAGLHWYVSNSGDDINNRGNDPTSPFKTLGKAIDATVTNRDIIFFLAGNYSGLDYETSLIATTIQSANGSGTVNLTCQQPNSTFFVIDSYVTLIGLAFHKCHSAVSVNPSISTTNTTIQSCSFQNNNVSLAISSGIVQNSTFKNDNVSIQSSFNVWDPENNPNTLTLSNVTVKNSTYAGQFLSMFGNALVTWANSTIQNSSIQQGTLFTLLDSVLINVTYVATNALNNFTNVLIESLNSSWALSNPNFSGYNVTVMNSTSFVNISGGKFTLESSLISSSLMTPIQANSIDALILRDTRITGTRNAVLGGALFLQDGHIYAENLTIDHNNATSGGAIYCTSCDLTLNISLIFNNSASIGGYIDCANNGSGSSIVLTNTTLMDNWATSGDRGQCNDQPQSWYVSPTGSDFNEGNKSFPFLTIDAAYQRASNIDKILLLAGIHTNTVKTVLTQINISAETQTNETYLSAEGGVTLVCGSGTDAGPFITVDNSVTLTGLSFTSCNPAVSTTPGAGNVAILACSFTVNPLAINLASTSAFIMNTSFINNTVDFTLLDSIVALQSVSIVNSRNSSIFAVASNLTMLESNISSSQYTAIISTSSGINLTSTRITNTRSANQGGALFLSYSQVYANNAMLDHNNAVTGGGFFCTGGNIYFEDSFVTDNTAEVGGAFDCNGCVINLVNTTVTDNLSKSGNLGACDSSEDDDSDSGMSAGAVVGIVIAILVVVGGVVGFCVRRRMIKNRKQPEMNESLLNS